MVMRMMMMIKYSSQVVRFAVYVYFTLSLIASQEVSRDPYTFVPIFLILKVGMTIIMSMMMRMMMLTIVMMMMMMRFQGAPTPLSSSWEDDLAHLKVFDGAQYPLSPPRDTHPIHPWCYIHLDGLFVTTSINFPQFVFFVGWLEVAESIENPFGNDDDDFQVIEK